MTLVTEGTEFQQISGDALDCQGVSSLGSSDRGKAGALSPHQAWNAAWTPDRHMGSCRGAARGPQAYPAGPCHRSPVPGSRSLRVIAFLAFLEGLDTGPDS